MAIWDFSDLLRIPISILPYLGTDDMLDPSYGVAVSGISYIDEKITKIVDREGNEALSNIAFYINSVYHDADTVIPVVVKPDDLILFNEITYRIKSQNTVRDIDGNVAIWVVYG